MDCLGNKAISYDQIMGGASNFAPVGRWRLGRWCAFMFHPRPGGVVPESRSRDVERLEKTERKP